MGAAGWIIAIPMLVVVLLAAFGPDDDAPTTPRRAVYRRHAWSKMLREEEREGVREPRSGTSRSRAGHGAEPQAKWSDRR
jgi:hypothetical protein